MADSTQISNKLRPPCTKCGKPLLLTRSEPEKPGFELRVYYCASCGASDRVIAPLWAGAAPDLRCSQSLRRESAPVFDQGRANRTTARNPDMSRNDRLALTRSGSKAYS